MQLGDAPLLPVVPLELELLEVELAEVEAWVLELLEVDLAEVEAWVLELLEVELAEVELRELGPPEVELLDVELPEVAPLDVASPELPPVAPELGPPHAAKKPRMRPATTALATAPITSLDSRTRIIGDSLGRYAPCW